MISKKKYTLLGVLLLLCNLTYAQKLNFDAAWKFAQEDIVNAANTQFIDNKWRILDLPHDWSIEGEYNVKNPTGAGAGYLPTGIGWYRKTINVPANWKGKYVEILFDGIFMNSEVYANGKKLGFRPLGWVSFAYDVSNIVNQSKTITFAVRVDNSLQPAARWYTGSGIYAHTWISIKNQIRIPQNGIFITTKNGSAIVNAEVFNPTNRNDAIILKNSILDKNGKILSSVNANVKLKAKQTSKIEQTLNVKNPQLWSLETPYLYTLLTQIFDGKKLITTEETHFGFRDIVWKPESGMWLNGKNVKLQGVCNHQDAGALGAAVPDKILKFRIQQLKSMGVNCIRTSHNAQTPIFYQYCDEMGMMVMDEFFDGWKTKAAKDYGNQAFADWWKRDLTDLVKRDRNHPSVIIYSVGNETSGSVAKELVATCHQLDSTRLVTSGHSGSADMDVFGVNGSSEKKGWFDNLATDKVFIATENPHTWQVRGFYNTKTWWRDGMPNSQQKFYAIPDLTDKEIFFDDWTFNEKKTNKKQIFNSSYDNATVRLTARHSIEQLRDIPNYAGSFRWTGYDYIGEASYVHGGWPFKAFMGGAIDLANFEKDLFYLYQSQWTSKPMVHILPHWTHPNVAIGTEIPVWVYSNADEVELFFNGKSLGKIKPGKDWDKMQCQWMVKWQPGELKALAYKDGKIAVQEIVRTTNAPSKNSLSIDGEPLAKTGKDIVQVRVAATDSAGEFYPYGENRTFFKVYGPARVKALDNGSPINVEKHYQAKDLIAFFGLTRAYIEALGNDGDINLLASAILGDKKLKVSDKVSIDAQMYNLRGAKKSANIKIYYTLDGTQPTEKSNLYTGSFIATLGTTVKALVTVDGEKAQYLNERFVLDEGFVWNDKLANTKKVGEQAEDAKFEGAEKVNGGKNFNGNSFLKFNEDGGFVEWYQENDGATVDATLNIRYSSKYDVKVKVLNNNLVIANEVLLKASEPFGAEWNTEKIKFKLLRGANQIKIEVPKNQSLAIDEITII